MCQQYVDYYYCSQCGVQYNVKDGDYVIENKSVYCRQEGENIVNASLWGLCGDIEEVERENTDEKCPDCKNNPSPPGVRPEQPRRPKSTCDTCYSCSESKTTVFYNSFVEEKEVRICSACHCRRRDFCDVCKQFKTSRFRYTGNGSERILRCDPCQRRIRRQNAPEPQTTKDGRPPCSNKGAKSCLGWAMDQAGGLCRNCRSNKKRLDDGHNICSQCPQPTKAKNGTLCNTCEWEKRRDRRTITRGNVAKNIQQISVGDQDTNLGTQVGGPSNLGLYGQRPLPDYADPTPGSGQASIWSEEQRQPDYFDGSAYLRATGVIAPHAPHDYRQGYPPPGASSHQYMAPSGHTGPAYDQQNPPSNLYGAYAGYGTASRTGSSSGNIPTNPSHGSFQLPQYGGNTFYGETTAYDQGGLSFRNTGSGYQQNPSFDEPVQGIQGRGRGTRNLGSGSGSQQQSSGGYYSNQHGSNDYYIGRAELPELLKDKRDKVLKDVTGTRQPKNSKQPGRDDSSKSSKTKEKTAEKSVSKMQVSTKSSERTKPSSIPKKDATGSSKVSGKVTEKKSSKTSSGVDSGLERAFGSDGKGQALAAPPSKKTDAKDLPIRASKSSPSAYDSSTHRSVNDSTSKSSTGKAPVAKAPTASTAKPSTAGLLSSRSHASSTAATSSKAPATPSSKGKAPATAVKPTSSSKPSSAAPSLTLRPKAPTSSTTHPTSSSSVAAPKPKVPSATKPSETDKKPEEKKKKK